MKVRVAALVVASLAVASCGSSPTSAPTPGSSVPRTAPRMVLLTNVGTLGTRMLRILDLAGGTIASLPIGAAPARVSGRQVLSQGPLISPTKDRAYYEDTDGRLAWVDSSGRQGDDGSLPPQSATEWVTLAVRADDRQVAVGVQQDRGDHVHEDLWVANLPLGSASSHHTLLAQDIPTTTIQAGSGPNPTIVVVARRRPVHLPLGWLGDQVVNELYGREMAMPFELRDPVTGKASLPCPTGATDAFAFAGTPVTAAAL